MFDGLSFFSSNMLFVLLISMPGMLPPGEQLLGIMFAFSLVSGIVFSLLSVGTPWVLENIYRYLDKLNAQLQSKITAINDMYIGQWAWLLGFSWWTTLVLTLSEPYINCFDEVGMWWLLVSLISMATVIC